ncbi:MAG: glycosyltransferase family 4 protein [Candidatus Azambacteria bacterium]|nr:glycosyltransferase family 4 protein [Candidatus Azambacteria bacterium]
MRIARIIEYFPPHIGGMEGHGLNLSLLQKWMGHDLEVFIGYGGEWKTNFEGVPSDFPIHIMPLQFLPLYSKARRFWFNLWAARQMKKYHRVNPYDIVHLHGDFVEAYFGGKLSKKLNIPAILTIHAGLNKKYLKPKNAKYFSNISKIICVSEEIAGDLKSIGIPENKLAVISSGIYLSEFKKADSNKIADLRSKYSKPIIVSIGVLRPAKGFKYLVDAFKKIKEKFNNATLIIIGDGPDRMELKKQAQGIGGINFLGRQDNDRVIEYLKAADVFVLASIFMEGDREGTSNSIMEAMAAGLPIVATKVGGNPYLIREGENGLLVEEKNSEALTETMIKLIRDESLRQKMSDKNLEDIKEKDWPLIAKQITDLYKNDRK